MTDVPRGIQLQVTAHPSALAPLRRSIREWLGDAGALDAHDVVLAIDEAVTNAIEHAGGADDATIDVKLELIGDLLHVQVVNQGTWKEAVADETRGRGILIMNALMETVTIEHSGNETRLAMSRRLG